MTRTICYYSAVAVLLLSSTVSRADGFGINATRLIYPENEKSISVTLRNTMKNSPYLVQTSVSTEQSKAVAAPFIVTPPLFRLEPQSTNQVRIAFKGSALPRDRESVFYFNATGIPASSSYGSEQQIAGVRGMVQFGVGNIIKIFFRPNGLKMTSDEAQKNLTFSIVANGLKVSNTSPYFVSFASLQVAGKRIALDTAEQKMIAPFSSHIYPISAKAGVLSWQTINDVGGIDAHTGRI